MKQAVGIILFSVSIAATAVPLQAQESGFEQRMFDRICSQDKPVDDSRSVDRLTRRLDLTDPQKAALKDLVDATTKARSDTQTAFCAEKPNLSTTPMRTAFATKMLESRLSGMRAVQPKLQAFYDSLDDKQKAAFDSGGRVGGLFSFFNRFR
jgi:hypothetical protein